MQIAHPWAWDTCGKAADITSLHVNCLECQPKFAALGHSTVRVNDLSVFVFYLFFSCWIYSDRSFTCLDDKDGLGQIIFIITIIIIIIAAELNCKELADFLLVKSKFEERALINRNKMDCTYARNPFSNKQPGWATNEDILQGTNVPPSIAAGTNEFTDNWFWRDIPYGSGSLKTPSGEPIYSGDWCEGTGDILFLRE